jgi:hypothetical protein
MPFDKHLFRMLAAISAFRFIEGPAIRAARKSFAEAESARVSHLAIQVRQGRASQDQLEMQYLEALDRIGELELERDKLKDDLEAQKVAWIEFQQFTQSEHGQEPQPERPEEAAPHTVADVVRMAREVASRAILYLESSIESAEKSPFKNTQRVGELLEAIDVVAARWVENKGVLGQTWEQAFGDLGFEYGAKVSQTSKTRWKSDYEFTYEGKKRLFQRHITIGSGQPETCLSVHWDLDEDDQQKDKSKKRRRLVIAHCGRHLTNTTS